MNEDITLKEMENAFDALYGDNDFKDTLLRYEIRGYKLLFDKDELPLSVISNKDMPLREYDISYTSQQIFLIREFHRLYNVKKNDLSKMYTEDWNSRTQYIYNSAWGDFLEPSALAEPHGPKFYIELAKKLSKYLEWLEKKNPVQNGEPIIKEKKRNEPNTVVLAYYYHILHKVDSSKRFDLDPAGKINVIWKVAEEKGVSKKNLQTHYNKLNNSKLSGILTRRKISIILKVIELFKDNPDCLKVANEYLKIAEQKK